jgi:hypothetical protein
MLQQSGALIGAFEANPRVTSVFATQQRWLMAHAAFELYFRRHGSQFTASEFFELVTRHKIASRNTADAFIKEMAQYGLAHAADNANDRRTRPIVPSEESQQQIAGWLMLHIATLDGLDGGERVQAMLADGHVVARVQPLIATALLTTPLIREPTHTFALFPWLKGGGIVMDRIMTSIQPFDPASDRIITGVTSVNALISGLVLSRSQIMRKLCEAAALGSLGWEGKSTQSALWVSHGFCGNMRPHRPSNSPSSIAPG